jgi:uncharacterized protein YecT (DUF1311 family)
MAWISRQSLPSLAALALLIVFIPGSMSSPSRASRLSRPESGVDGFRTAVPDRQTFAHWLDGILSLDRNKALLAGLDCRHPGTQAEISNCAALLAKESDQMLNQMYQKLRASLSADQVKLLVTAQLAWIKLRDDHCALEKSFLAGGSLSVTAQLTCVKRMSDARTTELKGLLSARNFDGNKRPALTAPVPGLPINPQADTLIGPGRIGPAAIGATLGALRQALPDQATLQPKQRLMVDSDAIPLIRDHVVQLYILFPVGTAVTDASMIRALLTTNPNFKTQEGVGPGMKLTAAARIYGQPTLFYNTSSESREYVSFSRQPSRRIRFGVNRAGLDLAGKYNTPGKEYNQTQRYHAEATIAFVQVDAP